MTPARAGASLAGRERPGDDASSRCRRGPRWRPSRWRAGIVISLRRSTTTSRRTGPTAQAYYRPIDVSADPAGFYAALCALITDTHRTRLEYSPSTQLYPEVDLQPNGMIESIYSARQMDPEDLIRADAEVDRARRAALPAIAASRTLSLDDSRPSRAGSRPPSATTASTSSRSPGSRSAIPMKGDLHHLFACEMKCNEFRANTPYLDFTPDGAPSRPVAADRSREGSNRSAGKAPSPGPRCISCSGIRAKSTTPSANTRASVSTAAGSGIATIRSACTRTPNRAIQRKQGNRNPLVDHPEWADRIDFTRGLR